MVSPSIQLVGTHQYNLPEFAHPFLDYLTPYLYWNIAEGGFGILAICLPAMFHLTKQIRLMGPMYLLGRGQLKSVQLSQNTSTREIKNSERTVGLLPDWDNLYEGPGFGTYVTVSGGVAARQPNNYELSHPPLHGIGIREEVTMVVTDFA
jgi:hypothetical protein